MALVLHNSLTRKKEPFQPLQPGKVRMYNCGPTVYGQAHIGNFRAFLFADVLRRWLESSGYDVTQVMNLTDVGHLREDDEADAGADRMELASAREQLDPWKIAEKYIALFFQDQRALGIKRAHHHPRATEYIAEMIAMIEVLIAKGHAYVVDTGDVYYDVQSFPAYGQLSGNTLEDLEVGARIEVNADKRDPRDFALWKTDAKHLMQWDSPWGRGFPGWHVECSAMSEALLGEQLDIHTGGEDNIFPHHECEIAQSEGAHGTTFVRTWLHTRFLQVDGGKMSKTLGNLYTVDELSEQGYPPAATRLLLLKGHYRQVLNFTFEGLAEATQTVAKLQRFARETVEAADGAAARPRGERAGWVESATRKFAEGMDDDLNVSVALDGLFSLLRETNRRGPTGAEAADALAALHDMDAVLGVLETAGELREVDLDAEVEALITARGAAREARDWARADAIRDELTALGIELLDGKDGVSWRRIGAST